MRIDLNADLGEGGEYDADLMTVITSCNIACGGHAGDEATMREALSLSKRHTVAAGAHPSFPDREAFGRAHSSMRGAELEESLRAQIDALKQIANEMGVPLTHVKPHGALYNMAAKDTALSKNVVASLCAVLPGALLVGPPNSELESVAHEMNVTFLAEGFADRAYEADGHLRERSKDGALILDHHQQSEQALSIAMNQQVATHGGVTISLPAKTICVHGDTKDAFAAAHAIHTALTQNGISICAPA